MIPESRGTTQAQLAAMHLQAETQEPAKAEANPMKQFLADVEKIVCHDRQDAYGKAEDSFATIAEFWSTFLGHPLTSKQVAAMMVLLKVARLKGNPNHVDSQLDIAGYAANYNRIMHRELNPVVEF